MAFREREVSKLENRALCFLLLRGKNVNVPSPFLQILAESRKGECYLGMIQGVAEPVVALSRTVVDQGLASGLQYLSTTWPTRGSEGQAVES